MSFVYSTLANDNRYTGYVQGGADIPSVERSILIKGGAGVANDRVVTPVGVVTEVTDEELKFLRSNVVFQRHEKNGFLFVTDTKADVENVVADMTGRDESAPLVAADFTANGQQAPTTTSKKK